MKQQKIHFCQPYLEYFFIFTLKIFSLKIKTKKNNMGKKLST